jgi:hypothetical protein
MKIVKASVERVAATVCGAIYIIVWFNLLRLLGLSNPKGAVVSLLVVVLIFGVLLLLVSALVGFTEWGSQISIPFFLVGVAVGVVVDALSDKTMDRNLFPIEAVIWCGILGVALGYGKELGARLKKRAS